MPLSVDHSKVQHFCDLPGMWGTPFLCLPSLHVPICARVVALLLLGHCWKPDGSLVCWFSKLQRHLGHPEGAFEEEQKSLTLWPHLLSGSPRASRQL